MPLAYRYASETYFGLGLPDYHQEQTIERLNLYMMHITASTLTGQHMRHTAEQLQLELGIGIYFMHTSYRQFGKYATKSWMQFLWKEISRLPITVTHRKPPTLPLQRDHDDYIMRIILELDKYSTTQLKSINNTRMFHQCYSLADIITGSGLAIQQNVRMRVQNTCTSTYKWPASKPCKADFDLWDSALDDILNRLKQQRKILGKWVNHTHTCPKYMYNHTANIIYIQNDRH